jgi:hypothetical protein
MLVKAAGVLSASALATMLTPPRACSSNRARCGGVRIAGPRAPLAFSLPADARAESA